MAFPLFGPHRHLAAILAGVAAGTANLWVFRRQRADQKFLGALAATDIGLALLVMALAPATFAPGLVLLTSMAALYIFWSGGELTLRILAPTSIILLAIGYLNEPPLWLPAWTAWMVTAAVGAAPLSRLAAASVALRNRYDDMVNGIDAVVWESHGTTDDALFMNDGVTELLGCAPEELCAFEDLLARVAPTDRPAVVESRRRASAGHDAEVHYELRDAQGRPRRLYERIRASRGSTGKENLRRGIIVDETARWAAEQAMRSYADFVDGLPIALAILELEDDTDPRSLRVIVGNPAAAALVGRRPEEVVGRLLCDMFPLSDLFARSLADVAREQEILEQPFVKLEKLDRVFALRAIPLTDRTIGLMLEDVTDRANRSRSLKHQANHDHLTGLPNRAMFNDRLARAIKRSNFDNSRIAVLMVDLNQFKDVNDTLGHETGDLLLIELARRLSSDLRYCDTVARLGGDEFAVLLSDSADHHSSNTAAHRVLELCEEPFEIQGYRLQISASVGIAVAPDHATDARGLLRHADRAMYRAKAAGGGVVMYSPLQDQEGVTRISLLDDLRSAVTAEQLVLHYQPQVDLRTGETVAVEALVRWRHPRRGLLSPAEFIELAEISGEIDALTLAVVRRSVADISTIAPAGGMGLHVNLSARSLRDPRFLEHITSILTDEGFDPGALCLEIRETQLLEDLRRASAALAYVRSTGVRLGVDDFGAGGSTVPNLRRLPIAEVKIDPQLVSEVATDATVVHLLVELAHNLGLRVVAEGVETPEVLDIVRSLGCDAAQGFHLAAPMPLEDLARHLGATVDEHVARTSA